MCLYHEVKNLIIIHEMLKRFSTKSRCIIAYYHSSTFLNRAIWWCTIIVRKCTFTPSFVLGKWGYIMIMQINCMWSLYMIRIIDNYEWKYHIRRHKNKGSQAHSIFSLPYVGDKLCNMVICLNNYKDSK